MKIANTIRLLLCIALAVSLNAQVADLSSAQGSPSSASVLKAPSPAPELQAHRNDHRLDSPSHQNSITTLLAPLASSDGMKNRDRRYLSTETVRRPLISFAESQRGRSPPLTIS